MTNRIPFFVLIQMSNEGCAVKMKIKAYGFLTEKRHNVIFGAKRTFLFTALRLGNPNWSGQRTDGES